VPVGEILGKHGIGVVYRYAHKVDGCSAALAEPGAQVGFCRFALKWFKLRGYTRCHPLLPKVKASSRIIVYPKKHQYPEPSGRI
jgi:hypothetical protein